MIYLEDKFETPTFHSGPLSNKITLFPRSKAIPNDCFGITSIHQTPGINTAGTKSQPKTISTAEAHRIAPSPVGTIKPPNTKSKERTFIPREELSGFTLAAMAYCYRSGHTRLPETTSRDSDDVKGPNDFWGIGGERVICKLMAWPWILSGECRVFPPEIFGVVIFVRCWWLLHKIGELKLPCNNSRVGEVFALDVWCFWNSLGKVLKGELGNDEVIEGEILNRLLVSIRKDK